MLRTAEKRILNLNNYGDFCLATSPDDASCSNDALVSISKLFTEAELEDGVNNSELTRVLNEVFEEDVYDEYSYLFGKGFK